MKITPVRGTCSSFFSVHLFSEASLAKVVFEIACILKVICLSCSVEMEIKSNFMVRVLWGNQIMEFAKSLEKQED